MKQQVKNLTYYLYIIKFELFSKLNNLSINIGLNQIYLIHSRESRQNSGLILLSVHSGKFPVKAELKYRAISKIIF